MKNISRRVFIKGLAVAGVAAAASTVLAGCNTNMIPGVDDGAEDDTVEETPVKEQVLEYTDNKGKKLTITAAGCDIIKSNKTAILTFKVDNGTAAELNFAAATGASNGDIYIAPADVKVYFDGDDDNTVDGDAIVEDGVGSMFTAAGVKVASGKDATLLLTVNTLKEWKKVTVVLEAKMKSAADYTLRKREFTFENK